MVLFLDITPNKTLGSNANAYVFFNSKESILLIMSLINGKIITPKIHALYRLIDWINNQQSEDSFIPKLPQNSEPLGSNP